MSGAAENEAVSEKKKSKKTIIIAVLAAIVIIALVAVIIVLLLRNSGDSRRQTQSSVRTVLDDSSAANVMDQMREEVAEGMFECEMSTTWTFADGSAESKDAYVANSVNNTHPIFFDVYVGDSDSGEMIYSSPILPVGTDVTDIKLDKALPAGNYKCTALYSLLESEKNQEVISKAGFVITIKVLN